MDSNFTLRIFEDSVNVYEETFEGPLEIGRQDKAEEGPFALGTAGGCQRLIIANVHETTIARHLLLITPQSGRELLLQNLSTQVTLVIEPGRHLLPSASAVVSLPATLRCGRKVFSLSSLQTMAGFTINPPARSEMDSGLQSLSEATRGPGYYSGFVKASIQDPARALGVGDSEPLIRSIQAILDVLNNAATAGDFYERAAKAIVDLVGLDSGRVLIWENGKWKPEAMASATGIDHSKLSGSSSRVLEQVREQKRTFWQLPADQLISESLMNVQSVVAAPLLNEQNEVFGALYGDRGLLRIGGEITKLEALLIELLACGVASVLVRMKHQESARTQQVRFEQFFTKQLAAQLEREPDLLRGREAEVSILFCDIRGFSRITQELGAAKTLELINEVLEALSDSVLETEGVLVDYIGDELMAMWGAPEAQVDHPERACRAALRMLGKIPELNARWKSVLNQSFSVGIGINTGRVHVGNTGSQRKFKYGPLGHAVNLASRVQGATKYLRSPLLVTGSTFERLGSAFKGRRLCAVQTVNINEPVQLFELSEHPPPNWEHLRSQYEQALGQFERGEFRQAAVLLSNSLSEFPEDGPSLLLLSRAANAMIHGADPRHPVWELPGK